MSTGKRLVTPRQRVRGALRAHLPPGRYVIHARVVAYSFKARGRRGLVQCKLRGDTATTHYAVIDWAHAVYSARRPMASETISLVGMHDVTTSGRVKVDCFSRNGGTLGLRKLVAIKVGAGN